MIQQSGRRGDPMVTDYWIWGLTLALCHAQLRQDTESLIK